MKLLSLVQKIHRPDIQGPCRMPECQEGHVLLTAFDQAYVSAIHAHALCKGFLAEPRFQPICTKICAECVANIHP